MKSTVLKRQHSLSSYGFSVVELIIVISVIGVLAALTAVYLPDAQLRSRNTERVADVESIARQIEQYYNEGASTVGPTYPSTSNSAGPLGLDDFISLTSGKGDRDILWSPRNNSSTPSLRPIDGGANNTGPQDPSTEEYLYQPFRSDRKVCNFNPSDTDPCVRFRLWYRTEDSSAPQYIESRHQQ